MTDERILIDQDAGGGVDELQRTSGGGVVNQIAIEIQRTAERRLRAECGAGRVEAAILKHADVARPAIGFDAVVRHVGKVIVVEIDGNRQPVFDRVGRAVGIAISGDVDAIVPIGGVVVGDHVALAVDLHRVFGGDGRRITGELRPDRRGPPALQLVGIVAADEYVVRDVEILRARPIVFHAAADIFEAGMLQGESAGSGDVLYPEQERDVGISNGDAFKVVVIPGHQVE